VKSAQRRHTSARSAQYGTATVTYRLGFRVRAMGR
jgi:hypothetical protein